MYDGSILVKSLTRNNVSDPTTWIVNVPSVARDHMYMSMINSLSRYFSAVNANVECARRVSILKYVFDLSDKVKAPNVFIGV
jgi:hypothetical protein